jgi:hypothetical protein
MLEKVGSRIKLPMIQISNDGENKLPTIQIPDGEKLPALDKNLKLSTISLQVPEGVERKMSLTTPKDLPRILSVNKGISEDKPTRLSPSKSRSKLADEDIISSISARPISAVKREPMTPSGKERQLTRKMAVKKRSSIKKEEEKAEVEEKQEKVKKTKKKRGRNTIMRSLPFIKFGSEEMGKSEKIESGIETLQDFMEYVFSECSNCVTKEIYISEIKDSKIYDKYRLYEKYPSLSMYEEQNCKEIKTAKLSERFLKKESDSKSSILKVKMVFKILELFVSKGLLNRNNKMYFLLNTNRRLTWSNIKQLKSKHIDLEDDVMREIFNVFNDERKFDMVTLVKSLFWLLRKAIVDSILSDIINGAKKKFGLNTISAVSVGSMKLSSDYDVSLDTKYDVSALIMKRYNKVIETIFKDESSNVFDTNVYGVSFAKKTKDEIFSDEHECNNNRIHYIPIESKKWTDDNTEISQVIWCYIKLLLRMNMILKYDDMLYDKLYTYLDDELKDNIIFETALDFMNMYKADENNYGEVVSRFNTYMESNKEVGEEEYLVSNFISFVNYNGSETYLTHGAFLDVVVNQQMCGNKDIIKLNNPYLYFTSFVENISDLLIHYHKVKYLNRAKSSLTSLYNVMDSWIEGKVYDELMEKLELIGEIQKRCEEEVYKCQGYELMHLCVEVIKTLSLIFYTYMKYEYSKNLERSVIMFSRLRFPDVLEQSVENVIEGEMTYKMSEDSLSNLSSISE